MCIGVSRISRRNANSRGGRQPIILANFSQKLHKNKRNWTGEGARPWFSPLDPPVEQDSVNIDKYRWGHESG